MNSSRFPIKNFKVLITISLDKIDAILSDKQHLLELVTKVTKKTKWQTDPDFDKIYEENLKKITKLRILFQKILDGIDEQENIENEDFINSIIEYDPVIYYWLLYFIHDSNVYQYINIKAYIKYYKLILFDIALNKILETKPEDLSKSTYYLRFKKNIKTLISRISRKSRKVATFTDISGLDLSEEKKKLKENFKLKMENYLAIVKLRLKYKIFNIDQNFSTIDMHTPHVTKSFESLKTHLENIITCIDDNDYGDNDDCISPIFFDPLYEYDDLIITSTGKILSKSEIESCTLQCPRTIKTITYYYKLDELYDDKMYPYKDLKKMGGSNIKSLKDKKIKYKKYLNKFTIEKLHQNANNKKIKFSKTITKPNIINKLVKYKFQVI